MRTLLAAVVCSMLVAVAGCKSDNGMKSDRSATGGQTMGTMDVCSHCPGVQKATADGKCEACGMKVASGGGNAK